MLRHHGRHSRYLLKTVKSFEVSSPGSNWWLVIEDRDFFHLIMLCDVDGEFGRGIRSWLRKPHRDFEERYYFMPSTG